MVQYTNYQGDRYYLHGGLNKKGNPVYWFSKSTDGKLAERIPTGFEIYEEPNGMVYLCRIQPKIITEKEVEVVTKSIPRGLDTKVDVKKNMITI